MQATIKKKFIKVNNKQKNITKIFRSQKSIAIPMLLGRESSCINSQCWDVEIAKLEGKTGRMTKVGMGWRKTMDGKWCLKTEKLTVV